MLRPALLLTVSMLPLTSQAQTCDEIKAGIDSRMRERGLSGFALTVVEATASEPGRVVGVCGQGSRKILYRPGAGGASVAAPAGGAAPASGPAAGTGAGAARPAAAAATAAARPASWPASGPRPWAVPAGTVPKDLGRPAPRRAPTADILTECLDGTEQMGGECGKR